jgi:3-carboxy-cis,cis-muconate cycloisomerase
MPHKESPVGSERTVGLAAMIRHAATVNAVTETYDERDAGFWYVEYGLVPETFVYLSRALRNSREVLETLEVHPENMASNLGIHGGLLASEAVMMALAEVSVARAPTRSSARPPGTHSTPIVPSRGTYSLTSG